MPIRLTAAEKRLAKRLAEIKKKSGSHSPSPAMLRDIAGATVKHDFCFLSNSHATDLFLKYWKRNLGNIKRLRKLIELYPSQNRTLAEKLAREGVEAIQLCADMHGNVRNGKSPVFIKDALRRVHSYLVSKGIRDQVTLIADGGIALPEHLAKAIICGADAAAVDLPFLIALECRMCMNCKNGLPCPVDIHSVPPADGAQRIMNLSAAWRNQLLEVLGAMGIREVRRLRGEVGRAMFIEDLERDTFGKIFGNRHVRKARRDAN